jgi:hypothetical protein
LRPATGGNGNSDHEPNPELTAPLVMVAAALDVIPNPDVDWETYKKVCMATYSATGGSAEGFMLFDRWAKKSKKYRAEDTAAQWYSCHRSPPNRIGFGSLRHWAWAQPSRYNDFDDQVSADLRAAAENWEMPTDDEADDGSYEEKIVDLKEVRSTANDGVTRDDFLAYMPMHNYIYIPTRDLWPGASVNARVPPIPILDANGNAVLEYNGDEKFIKASTWLDQNQPVEQMAWSPGLPMLIRNRLVSTGGWIERCGVSCFNLCVQPVGATPLVVYRLAFGSPRSFADVD